MTELIWESKYNGSGIVNDPNNIDDPEYIVRLIKKVITVSLKTVEIVKGVCRQMVSDTFADFLSYGYAN